MTVGDWVADKPGIPHNLTVNANMLVNQLTTVAFTLVSCLDYVLHNIKFTIIGSISAMFSKPLRR